MNLFIRKNSPSVIIKDYGKEKILIPFKYRFQILIQSSEYGPVIRQYEFKHENDFNRELDCMNRDGFMFTWKKYDKVGGTTIFYLFKPKFPLDNC